METTVQKAKEILSSVDGVRERYVLDMEWLEEKMTCLENSDVTVAVAGEIDSGKCALVNAAIGKPLLGSARGVGSQWVSCAYGDNARAVVHFRERAPLALTDKWLTPGAIHWHRSGVSSRDRVWWTQLEAPHYVLAKETFLVVSPDLRAGRKSSYHQHILTGLAQTPDVHVYMEAPGSGSDGAARRYLRAVAKRGHPVIIALNMDMVEADEGKQDADILQKKFQRLFDELSIDEGYVVPVFQQADEPDFTGLFARINRCVGQVKSSRVQQRDTAVSQYIAQLVESERKAVDSAVPTGRFPYFGLKKQLLDQSELAEQKLDHLLRKLAIRNPQPRQLKAVKSCETDFFATLAAYCEQVLCPTAEKLGLDFQDALRQAGWPGIPVDRRQQPDPTGDKKNYWDCAQMVWTSLSADATRALKRKLGRDKSAQSDPDRAFSDYVERLNSKYNWLLQNWQQANGRMLDLLCGRWDYLEKQWQQKQSPVLRPHLVLEIVNRLEQEVLGRSASPDAPPPSPDILEPGETAFFPKDKPADVVVEDIPMESFPHLQEEPADAVVEDIPVESFPPLQEEPADAVVEDIPVESFPPPQEEPADAVVENIPVESFPPPREEPADSSEISLMESASPKVELETDPAVAGLARLAQKYIQAVNSQSVEAALGQDNPQEDTRDVVIELIPESAKALQKRFILDAQRMDAAQWERFDRQAEGSVPMRFFLPLISLRAAEMIERFIPEGAENKIAPGDTVYFVLLDFDDVVRQDQVAPTLKELWPPPEKAEGGRRCLLLSHPNPIYNLAALQWQEETEYSPTVEADIEGLLRERFEPFLTEEGLHVLKEIAKAVPAYPASHMKEAELI